MTRIPMVVLVAALPLPAVAQSGAFNMGGLTGTLSQDALTQSEERRARPRARPSRVDARMAYLCRIRHRLRREPGDGPDYRRLISFCRSYGF